MQAVELPSGARVVGLTAAEVADRRAHGQANPAPAPSSRSYWQIVRENIFTFVNNVLFGLGIALVLVGRPLDALVSVGVVTLNTLVSVVQEVRAKRTLDRIALLTRPKATALRDGTAVDLSPDELVLGDVLKFGLGDQVVLDGRVLQGHVEMDESIITGESEPVPKNPDDLIYSGTFCVAGTGFYVATAVGEASFASRITTGARTFRRVLTPLERQVNLVVRLLLLIMVSLQLLLALRAALLDVAIPQAIGNATVVAGLVPNGLFLSISIAYALGSLRLVRTGLLVQQSNAIESLSNVDTLVFDKTGTLTTNHLQVSATQPSPGVTQADLERALATLAASATAANKTTRAIAAAFPGSPQPLLAEVPFSSSREWSAIATSDGVLALGAPEALGAQLTTRLDHALDEQTRQWRAGGLRVLVVGHGSDPSSLRLDGELPPGMQALGAVAISDQLRPGVADTLTSFVKAGVTPKIISGDNPETVAALARQAGFKADLRTASGSDLTGMDGPALADLADRTTVFGRIGPQDKARLVSALRSRQHYVAMLGDGVNDVLALKSADLAVAINSGSQAARSVADIVLLNDSFDALVPAVAEGQRIRNGMHSILKLYLTRIGMVALVIVSSLVIGIFPIDVRNGSAVTLFSVGVPTLALTIWARPGPVRGSGFGRELANFVVPAVVLASLVGVFLFYAVLWIGAGYPDLDGTAPASQLGREILMLTPLAQTSLTAFLVFCGLALFASVVPPREDRRPILLAGALGAIFLVVMVTPLRVLFALRPMDVTDVVVVLGALVAWLVLLTAARRGNVLERYLDTAGRP